MWNYFQWPIYIINPVDKTKIILKDKNKQI